MPSRNQSILVLATRRSPLARRQAELASEAFADMPGAWWKKIKLLELTTTGDRQRDWSLAQEGGKGLFTRELEEALLSGRAHLAIHSAKDLPTALPEGLTFAGFLPRADVRDVLVRRADVKIPRRIATGSPRRRAQAQAWWPEVEWVEIRGNLDTRLKKIAAGEADATFLAAAGLKRLGIEKFPGLMFKPLPIAKMIPAAGQGAIALECRAGEAEQFHAVRCESTTRAVLIERAALAALGGGCQMSSAAHFKNGQLHIYHEPKGRAVFSIVEKSTERAIAAAITAIGAWLKAKQ